MLLRFDSLEASLYLALSYRSKYNPLPSLSPAIHSNEFREKIQAIENGEREARTQFATKLGTLFHIIEFTRSSEEALLQRLLQYARDFVHPFRTIPQPKGHSSTPPDPTVIGVYAKILWSLVHTCGRVGRTSAADRYCLELGANSADHSLCERPDIRDRLWEAIRRTSEMMQQAHQGLPSQNTVPGIPGNLFPPSHLAIMLQLPALPAQHEHIDFGKRSPDILRRQEIFCAIEADNEELVVDILSKIGPSQLEERDIIGLTPMLYAAHTGNIHIFKHVEAKSNREALDVTGRSALVLASEAGNYEIVHHLLDTGCSPDQFLPGQKYGALYASAAAGHSSIVKLLLERGANRRQVFQSDKSPEQIASENGYHEVCAMLREGVARRAPSSSRAARRGTPQPSSRPSTTPNSISGSSPNSPRRTGLGQAPRSGRVTRGKNLAEHPHHLALSPSPLPSMDNHHESLNKRDNRRPATDEHAGNSPSADSVQRDEASMQTDSRSDLVQENSPSFESLLYLPPNFDWERELPPFNSQSMAPPLPPPDFGTGHPAHGFQR